MIESIKNIVFDYSGTLRDDFDYNYEVTMRVFEKMGGARIPREEYKNEIRLPYMNFYNKYFPDAEQKEIDFLFFQGIDEVGRPKPRLYRGVRETLKLLASRSVKMTILSSGFHYELLRELKMLELEKYFPRIFGGVHNKVTTMPYVMKLMSFNPAVTLMVGDMTHDIDAGRLIGAKTVALTWGYYSRERLEKEASPDYIIDSLPEILLL